MHILVPRFITDALRWPVANVGIENICLFVFRAVKENKRIGSFNYTLAVEMNEKEIKAARLVANFVCLGF